MALGLDPGKPEDYLKKYLPAVIKVLFRKAKASVSLRDLAKIPVDHLWAKAARGDPVIFPPIA
jgi:hypothetical protein